jgi:hypothetical protein
LQTSRTSFAPETTRAKRGERGRISAKSAGNSTAAAIVPPLMTVRVGLDNRNHRRKDDHAPPLFRSSRIAQLSPTCSDSAATAIQLNCV